LPKKLRGELIGSIVYNHNDIPGAAHPQSTPRIIFEGRRLELSKRIMVPFGALVIMKVPGRESADKMTPRAEVGIVLGPSEETYGAMRCYSWETQKVVTRENLEIVPNFPSTFPFEIQEYKSTADFVIRESSRTNLYTEPRNEPSNDSATDDQSESEFMYSTEGSESTALSEYESSVEESRFNKLQSSPIPDWADAPIPTATGEFEEMTSELDSSVDEPVFTPRELKKSASGKREKDSRVSRVSRNQESAKRKRHELTNASRKVSFGTVGRSNRSANDSEDSGTEDHSASAPKAKAQKASLEALNKRYKEQNANRAKSRPKRSIRKPSRYQAFRISIKEAMRGDRSQECLEAVRGEIMNMINYQVGHFIKRREIPYLKRKNIVRAFMFLKHKEKPDGSYDKTKARLVANGANMAEHLYELISSATIPLSIVMLLLNIASMFKMLIATYDIKGAFLHAKFGPKDERIYLLIPPEIATIWVEMDPTVKPFLSEKGELYMELDRYLYGLKQSPLKFQQHLKGVLLAAGYQQHTQDECLYMKRTKDGRVSILSVHVDDILQISSDLQMEKELRDVLNKAYGGEVTYHPNADSYIGLSIERSSDKQQFKLTQKGLISKMTEKYLTDKDRRRASSPASEDLFHSDRHESSKDELIDMKQYLGLVMSLMYVARLSRPDILLSVTYLATRSHKANQNDWMEAKRVLRYLRDTVDLGLVIRCTSLQLVLVCDASFGVHMDGKSHTGWAITLGDSMSYVTCKSAKQKLVALSSTDAEIIAMVDCLKTAIWIRNILIELGLSKLAPMRMLQDNKSAIIMTTSDSKYKNSKHLLTRICFAKQAHRQGIFGVEYTKTDLMWADTLTKPLHGSKHVDHRSKVLGLTQRA
jgi:hypothetical protein